MRRSLGTSDFSTAEKFIADQDSVDELICARAVIAAHEGAGDGTVYLIAFGSGVKIGHTSNLKQRISMLQTGAPSEIRVLRVLSGGTALEAKLHSIFGDHRKRGEWFTLTPTMRAFIWRTQPIDATETAER